MNNRLHSKYHRHNHHTYTNPLIPDAGHDPIASPDSPFLGDFVISGALSGFAPLSAYAATFTGPNTAVIVKSPDIALAAVGNSAIFGDVYITGNLYGPFIPALYGRAGKQYSFSSGLSSSPSTNNVTLNLDLTSLYLNDSNQVAVNLSSIAKILGGKYTFGGGLTETLLPDNGVVAASLISVNTDNESICITSDGKLALVNYYNPSNGLTYNETTGNLSVNVDNSSIKICDNKLQFGYCIGASDSGLIRDGDNIKVNVDNSSLKILNNTVTSNFTFTSGVCLNTTNNKYEIGLNVDNTTVCVSPSNKLEAVNVLKTNIESTQTVNSPLLFNKRLRVGSEGIEFPDGTVLTTGFVANKVEGISTSTLTNQSGLIYTNSKNILGWGYNEYYSPVVQIQQPMWPPQPVNFEGSYNFSQNTYITNVQNNYEGVMALLSDNTLWSNGFPVVGYQANANDKDGDFILKQITFPDNAKISKFEVFSSGLNSAKYGVNEYINPSRTVAALSTTGQIFLFGNLRNDKKTNLSPLALIEGVSEIQYTPIQLSAVPIGSTSPDNLVLTSGFSDVKIIKVAETTDSTSVYGSYGTIVLALKDDVLYTAGYVDSNVSHRSLGNAIINNTLFDRNTTVPGSNKIPNYWYRLMPVLTNVKKIVTSPYFYKTIFVIKTDGTVWSCGMNSSATTFTQLFSNVLTNITDMVIMRSPVDINKTSFAALNSNGAVYVWGYNGSGHLGSTNINDFITTPTSITGIPGIKKLFCNNVFGTQILPSGATLDNFESSSDKSIRVLGALGNDGLMYIAGKTFQTWFTNTSSTTFNPIPIANVSDIEFTSSSLPPADANKIWRTYSSLGKQSINGIFIRDTSGRLFVLTKEATYSLAGFGLSMTNQPIITNSSPIELSAWL